MHRGLIGLKCLQIVCFTANIALQHKLLERAKQNTKPTDMHYLLEDMKDIMWCGASWLDNRLALHPNFFLVEQQ
jgi:hypothetical protein